MSLVDAALSYPALVPFVVLSLVSGYIFHEIAHFVAAQVVYYLNKGRWDKNLKFARDRWHPNVQINDPYGHTPKGICIYGIAPLIIGTVLVIISLILLFSSPMQALIFLFVGLGMALPVMGSGGDVLAVLSPHEFQEYASNTENEVPSFWEAIDLILN